MAPASRKQKSVAYLLWCLGFFGLCGVHRLYTERYVLGILYLFTFGFCFLGQLVDLLLIPDDVGSYNFSKSQRSVASLTPAPIAPDAVRGSVQQSHPQIPSQPAQRPESKDPLSARTRTLLAAAKASMARLDPQG